MIQAKYLLTRIKVMCSGGNPIIAKNLKIYNFFKNLVLFNTDKEP
jgi:hypothetical protein